MTNPSPTPHVSAMRSAIALLRPVQVEAIKTTFAAIRAGHTRTVLAMPTGAGKTLTGAAIVQLGLRRSRRVCFTVPALSLIDQTLERFVSYGIAAGDIGVIQADHPHRRPRAPVQIATVQTLARRDLPDADLVIQDECHVRSKLIETWMAARPELPFIGLSATPWTRGLGRHYGTLVKPVTLAQLIASGLLTPFRVFAPSHPDLSDVRTVAGDYHEGDLSRAMSKGTLVGDVVTTWLAKAEGRPTLVFAVDRTHARLLHEQFEAAGVPTAYVDANTPREEREEIGRHLAAGALKVVVNIGCLTTGVDWDVRCIVMARPTKSEMLYVQIVGRGLRTAPGKDGLLLLDHSDTVLRLGFPTHVDETHDCLDDGKPKPARAKAKAKARHRLPKACPACAYLMPAGTRACPACGEAMPLAVIPHREGELEEIAFDGRSIRPSGRKGPSVREQLQAMSRTEVIGELYTLRDERARQDGWVAHTFRAIFGVWPRGLDRAPPRPPSALLRAFVRSRDIAWAKANRKPAAEASHHAL